jgi:Ni/Co efflux regulator RcnB
MIKFLGYALVLTAALARMQPAFAEPGRFGNPPTHDNRSAYRLQHHPMDRDYDYPERDDEFHSNRLSWRVGKRLPDQYLFSEFQVDYRQNEKLSPPTRYQQWIKVNDRYMLINVMTNTILKIVKE